MLKYAPNNQIPHQSVREITYLYNLLFCLSCDKLLGVSSELTPQEFNHILSEKYLKILELSRDDNRHHEIRDNVEVRLGLKMLTIDYSFYYTSRSAVEKGRAAIERLHKLVYLSFYLYTSFRIFFFSTRKR